MKIEARLAGCLVGDGHPVRLMGVINASPESFFKGSVAARSAAISKLAERLTKEGADLIDIGAMSTAPYLKTHISESEEARRLETAVKAARKASALPISIDTARSGPAEAGFAAGAKILNDVRGLLGDPGMGALARRAEGVILMAHPLSLSQQPHQVLPDTLTALKKSLAAARRAGVPMRRIAVDPGIGFFRTAKMEWWRWDIEIIRHLRDVRKLGRPCLVGVSRKSFIGHLMGGKPSEERLAGSLAATVACVLNGAAIVRTHDVKETREAVLIAEGLKN